MYKIILNDSTSVKVKSEPVYETIIVKGLYVTSFMVELDSAEYPTVDSIKEVLGNADKTAVMDVCLYTEDDEVGKKYNKIEGYTKIQRIVNEDGTTVVYLVKDETFAEMINGVKKTVEEMKTSTKATVDDFEKTVETVQQDVATLKGAVKIEKTREEMTLDEYKEYKIKASKDALAQKLEDTTIESDVHGGVKEHYSITATKQQQLTAMIFLAQTNKDFQPSWNAAGKSCTYDWTLEELVNLAYEIQAVVRPLVSKQQKYEEDITAAASKDAVDKIIIAY